MLAAIRSLLFMPVFYVGSIPLVISAFVTAIFSKPALHRVSHIWGQYHYFCARWVLGIKVEVKGEFRNEALLYVFKHESMFETMDTLRIFDNPIVIAKKELLRIPLWGWAAKRHGLIPIDRDGGAAALRQIIKNAKAAVKENRPIVIFAEGSRAHRGQRPELQAGFAGLYKMFNLPLVPVALDSGRVSPRDTFVQNSGVITYAIQEEIPPGLDREEVRNRVHEAINALND